MRYFIPFLCLLILAAPATAQAQALPAAISKQVALPLEKVGEGTYRKFGFAIYQATLWAPGGEYNEDKPYALQLHYARSLSKETMSDAVIDDIKDQDVADAATFQRWQGILRNTLPAVEDGDEIVALSIPGKNSVIYFNGQELIKIREPALSEAFFGIWFGPKANKTLYSQLTGQ